SGRAPFVMGALGRAREIGAQTILLTCTTPAPVVAGVPATPKPGEGGSPATTSSSAAGTRSTSSGPAAAASTVDCDLVINLAVGPEILAGSTRLKAGTATKVALNIISTGAMARL